MNVTELNSLSKNRDDNGAGFIRTLSGNLMDLANPKLSDLHIDDIAHALSKQIRYNGHIPWDYTVARHSIIMSYYVPPPFAMEALLHDAGEAYCGDIIYPLKALYPELDDFEDNITGLIMTKWNGARQVHSVRKSNHMYWKSDIVAAADMIVYKHECHRFGRPGEYVAKMHEAERLAMKDVGLGSLYQTGMVGDRDAFLKRFYDLLPENS